MCANQARFLSPFSSLISSHFWLPLVFSVPPSFAGDAPPSPSSLLFPMVICPQPSLFSRCFAINKAPLCLQEEKLHYANGKTSMRDFSLRLLRTPHSQPTPRFPWHAQGCRHLFCIRMRARRCNQQKSHLRHRAPLFRLSDLEANETPSKNALLSSSLRTAGCCCFLNMTTWHIICVSGPLDKVSWCREKESQDAPPSRSRQIQTGDGAVGRG